MNWADIVNGLFEGGGAALTWMNVRQVWKDKGYAGIYLPAVILFFSWGVWNIYYYRSLHQYFSFHAGLVLVAANFAWIGLMLWYGKKGNN